MNFSSKKKSTPFFLLGGKYSKRNKPIKFCNNKLNKQAKWNKKKWQKPTTFVCLGFFIIAIVLVATLNPICPCMRVKSDLTVAKLLFYSKFYRNFNKFAKISLIDLIRY